jgi:hypothetical protein
MRQILMGAGLAAVCLGTAGLGTAAAEDIVLRGMGSFHVGGRVVEVKGKEVRMIVRQPGGPQTKLDANGRYRSSGCTRNISCRRTRRARCRS